MTTVETYYASGHCAVGSHDRCRGLYAGVACQCACGHRPPEPEPEPEVVAVAADPANVEPAPVIGLSPPSRPAGDVVDLFAGPGGWDTGVRALGIRPLGIEWDQAAVETGQAAGHLRYQADITALDPLDFRGARGLIASPPCQGFSVAGKGRGNADAELLLAAIPDMPSRDVRGELHAHMNDDRSVLVLEPLRWTLALTPSWLAWEQVPAVLPIWGVCAAVLRRIGYTVATGIVSSEQYGVPQTRRRAILVARSAVLSRTLGAAALPIATHSRYYSRDPQRLDPGVLPWVSMGEALGWPEPRTIITGQNSRQAGGATSLFRRSTSLPAPTLTGQARSWRLRSNYGTGGDPSARGIRTLGQPGPTITGKAGRNAWVDEIGVDHGRLSLAQAAILQSFEAAYPWTGGRVAAFQQVGDAVPPLLARAVVVAASGVSGSSISERVDGAA